MTLSMKNGLLIWNILLTLGLGFLLIQNFSGGSSASDQPATSDSPAGSTSAEELAVRYVHADSILSNFSEFVEQQEALATKEEAENRRLNNMMKAMEKDFMEVQQKIQQGLLTRNQIQEEEQRFAQAQQEMQTEQERVSRLLLQEGQELQDRLMDKLQRVLKEVQDANGYDLILSYGPGTGLLMAQEDLDITEDVLGRLNQPEE
jgi:outer membrane protein